MIKHVVLVKMKPEVTASQIAELKTNLAALPAIIPEIKGYDFGEDVRPEKTLDFALVSTFEDMAAVKRYLVHPDHMIVGKYIRSLCESLQIIDFEYN
ncbi:MAG: Dabb family protein [Syntrophales bacterium]